MARNQHTRVEKKGYIKNIYIHPNLTNSVINDMAILELTEDLIYTKTIQSIDLVERDVKIVENMTIKVATYGNRCLDCKETSTL